MKQNYQHVAFEDAKLPKFQISIDLVKFLNFSSLKSYKFITYVWYWKKGYIPRIINYSNIFFLKKIDDVV